MTASLRRDLWVLDARERADAAAEYRRACAHLFDITLLSPEAEFRNRMEGYNLAGVVMARCSGVPQRFTRKLSHIAADASDSVLAVLDLESGGWRGDYDGRQASSDMGSIRLIDMSRPFDMVTEAYETVHLILSRTALEPQAAELDFHGCVIREDGPSGRLLGSHLRALWASAQAMSATDLTLAGKAAAALVSAVILAHGAPSDEEVRPVEKMLLASAQRFVVQNLAEPDLSPEAVRRHLGVSRSLLYKVFEPAGGVSAFIQARRLDQAFDEILGDKADQQTLAEVGYRLGFRSDAHFSRAFRARFGMTPGRLRSLGERARREGLSAIERPDDVFAWVRGLL
ncbi:helix-turn-helix domain-containing protein [Caulobacter segnis]|uniref:AraC family transcriptional regulator n=1 Tax=Caulobacter segnis TaxID=88688 RepID=A0A2W5VHF5_9CAUL|nr:helix-turn-helix domain-containing protein [Caulobacter segnis]PZR37363.1 MAG: AraC family transcriptional regulator [Caulobacter segnis]